jgi:hypothetical protein
MGGCGVILETKIALALPIAELCNPKIRQRPPVSAFYEPERPAAQRLQGFGNAKGRCARSLQRSGDVEGGLVTRVVASVCARTVLLGGRSI